MRSLLPAKYHYYIYIFSLVLLVTGLPLSKFLMSLSQIIMIINWALEGDLRNKLNSFFKNKTALVLSSLILLHLLGLLYSTDINYAFKDIRIKAPLLVLPLVLSTSRPLTQRTFDILLRLFVGAIIIGTTVSSMILADVIHREVVDVRKVSVFISHIRFSLLICIAIFISGRFFRLADSTAEKIAWAAAVAWMLIFLVLMESMTGLMTLCFCVFMLILYGISISRNPWMRVGGLAAVFLSILGITLYVGSIAKEATIAPTLDVSKLERYTKRGNPYSQSMLNMQSENGNYVWLNYNLEEMEEAWNRRSKIKFMERDLKNNEIRFTLVRFLSSKGWKKDAEAVDKLSPGEIAAIERGVPNVKFQHVSSLRGRIHEICWELDLYRKQGVPNGHSLAQRFEYWQTAGRIIQANLLAGVGTGDVQRAFDEQYEKDRSPLSKEWRLRAHNQYLTFAVTFGIPGLLWFIFTLIFPLREKHVRLNFLYMTFFMVAVISFFTEDTLETQAGVTFFAFFNSFLLFINPSLKRS